jgi:predicted RNase H-like HicB family nuclease
MKAQSSLTHTMKIQAVIHPAEEGGYWAEVPGLPGCITEGDSMEEVLANLKDAIEGWLAVANRRTPIAPMAQVVEIAV